MYILVDNLLGVIHQKNKDLNKLTERLLGKLYSQVFMGNLDKRTYRNIHRAVQDSKNIKELNDILEYEINYKILIHN